MISRFLSAAMILAVTAWPATAGTVHGAYVGCLNSDMLDEFTTAAVNKDARQMAALFNHGCYSIEGREYSVVDRGFITSTIRVYAGGGSIKLIAPSEALKD
ncbi:hypothetical protein [Pararhizobium mangrovi]|uniref:Uncharacterized protein n=1 Tax=Pararhizobium mangrovi TaxID=2590452 RepID=A0A506TZ94_9HYPH|nr:hypothetical protein [Pararhizobium mangrovi]TPW26045.1 hypothetical protein FJU11_16665 [Pararhizobium mangrovi]